MEKKHCDVVIMPEGGFPTTGLSREDITNLLLGVVRLVKKYGTAEQVQEFFRMLGEIKEN